MLQKLHTAIVNGYNKIVREVIGGNEAALVVSWWDIIVLLIFTMLVFMFLGPIMDQLYIYIDNTSANPLTASFYTASDLKTTRDIYNVFAYIPYLAIGVVIFYALNYSNMKKGGE
jgi:hypothetical protein